MAFFGYAPQTEQEAAMQQQADRNAAWEQMKQQEGWKPGWGDVALGFGLSMLANNNGRQSFGELVGNSGLDVMHAIEMRKKLEAERARQAEQDAMERQMHDLSVQKQQGDIAEQSRMRKLLAEYQQTGDEKLLSKLYPMEWWKNTQAKAAADLAHQRALEIEGMKAGIKGEPKLSDVTGTRSKFMSESGDYLSMGGSLKKILAGAKEGSGAGDLSVVFSYMKVLDPTSTVREGEFATAENSAGVPAKVTSIYNKLLNGERLTPKQRRDFVSMSKSLFQAVEPEQAERVRQYTNLAHQYGVPVDMVVYSPYGDLMGQVDEYLNSAPVEPELPPVTVPGVLSSVPSHSNAPKVRIWNPQKGDFD